MIQGFVTCAYGAHVIGRVVIVFGICNASFSFASGYIIKVVGRPALFVFGAVMNIIVIIVMLSWTPRVSQEWVVYILGAMWGLGDAVWQTQVSFLLSRSDPNLYWTSLIILDQNLYLELKSFNSRSTPCTAPCSRRRRRPPSQTTGAGR